MSDKSQEGFEPGEKLSLGFGELICTIVITTAQLEIFHQIWLVILMMTLIFHINYY